MSSARASPTFIAPSAQRTGALRTRRSPVCVARPHAASRSAFLPPFLPPIPPRSNLVSTLSPPAPSPPSAPPYPSSLSPSPSTPTPAAAQSAAAQSAAAQSAAAQSAAAQSAAAQSAAALESPARSGRRHTAESRRKIAVANRGNVPWNKGRPHTEETRRRIALNTRKAMMRPEMRRLLQQKAKGRKHSEETKLKIRHAARRNHPSSHLRPKRRRPLGFDFPQTVVNQLNLEIAHQIDATFEREQTHDRRYVVRSKRPLSEHTRAKLSEKIKQLWTDPEYRARVSNGIRQRQRKRNTQPPASSTTQTVKQPQQPSASEPQPKSQLPCTPPAIVAADLDDDAIVIRSEDLVGITMEDLGITDTAHAGIVTRSHCNAHGSQSTTADQLHLPRTPDSHSSVQPATEHTTQPLVSPPPHFHVSDGLQHIDPLIHQLYSDDIHPAAEEPHPFNTDSAESALCNVPISPGVDAHVLDHPVRLPSEPDSLPLAVGPLAQPESSFSIPSEQYDHLNEFVDPTSHPLMNPELVSSPWLKSSTEDGEFSHSGVQSLDFFDVDSI